MLTAREHDALEARLAEEITILWQTDEVRSERPRVIDEIRHGLWFFEESLLDAGEALLAAYRRRVPGAAPPFSFGTWIGGDLDGNPAVGGATIAAALDRSRELALARYRREVRRAGGRRSRRAARWCRCRASSTSRSLATSASCRCTRPRSVT